MYELLYILLGVVQVAFAVWGGIVSAKSLPFGERKTLHVWGFVALGMIGLALTVMIGFNNYTAQQKADQAQEKAMRYQERTEIALAQSRLSEEYMKGQLTAVSIMIRQPARSGGDSLSASPLAISSQQLRAAATDLNKRMRRFEESYIALREKRRLSAPSIVLDYTAQDGHDAAEETRKEHEVDSAKLNEQEVSDFRAIFLDQANFLRTEMLKRINQPLRFSDKRQPIAFTGQLQGPSPISDAADYLDSLVKALPH